MPKFIKLKDEDGAEFAVNVEMITKIIPGEKDELTEVYLVDEEDALEVQELDGRDPGEGDGSHVGLPPHPVCVAPAGTSSAAHHIGCT